MINNNRIVPLESGFDQVSLSSSLLALLGSADYDTLSDAGAAFLAELRNKEYEKKKALVLSLHKGAIKKKERKKNDKTIEYWFTEIKKDKGYKQITATTETRLYKKLFDIYDISYHEKKYRLSDLFKIYYEERQNDESISSQTSDYDLSNWNRFLKDTELAGKDIRSIKPYDILSEYKHICKRGEYTRKAFSKAHSLLNGMFDFAVERQLIESNPSRLVSLRRLTFLPAPDNSDDVYSSEERERLMAFLREMPKQTIYTLAIQLAFCFCMRIGELRALTWDDYFPDKQKIYIRHSIIKQKKDGKKRCDVDVPHTKACREEGRRWVPVSNEAKKILEQLRIINGDKKYILQGSNNASFSISENGFNEHLRKYCKNAGIPYRSSHKFRFYGITALYDAGVDEPTIQYLAGHTTSDMTRKYRRSTIRDVDSDIIEQIFGKPE